MVLLQINNMSNKSLYQGYNYEVGCTKLSSERGIKNERERERTFYRVGSSRVGAATRRERGLGH